MLGGDSWVTPTSCLCHRQVSQKARVVRVGVMIEHGVSFGAFSRCSSCVPRVNSFKGLLLYMHTWFRVESNSVEPIKPTLNPPHFLIVMICVLTGTSGDCSARRERKRPCNCRSSQAEKSVITGIGTKKKINNVAPTQDMVWEKFEKQSSRTLYSECKVLDNCSKKEEQEVWRISHYY